VKYREIYRMVELDGWVMVAQRGSHRQYKHPTKPGKVTIHGPVRRGAPEDTEKHSSPGADREAEMKKYAIAIYKANGNYSAHVLDVDGSIASGGTVEETVANMKDALEFHFEGMAEDGEPIPEPEVIIEYVDVEVPEPASRK
jgi:predicted RNase H-like HicB family nuclease